MQKKLPTMAEMRQESYFSSGNEEYVESIYARYLSDPNSVDSTWRDFFDQLVKRLPRTKQDRSHEEVQQAFYDYALSSSRAAIAAPPLSTTVADQNVIRLIAAYRRLGHLQARINPLASNDTPAQEVPALTLAYHGFNTEKADFHQVHAASYLGLTQTPVSLAELQRALQRTYCGSIGFEYMHINREEEVQWLREKIEREWTNYQPDKQQRLRVLNRLIAADGLEKYLGFKYVGQKRFSLEGGDSLIPLLDAMIQEGSVKGIEEIAIGMAHRGRLNVLVNIVGKSPRSIFAAFEGEHISEMYSGDVKYHLGCSSDVKTKNGSLHLALSFNPSHLEIVSPVVQGSVRVRQRRRRDSAHEQVVPIHIHGDAAFAGQGVVMETINMSQTRWFGVGGSIHIIVNNQVGFTISDPQDARSTRYCTDVAKMVDAPILHVNANDPDAALFAALLALEYRCTFKRDVVIDLVCYRRHGHNEADEPSATQPMMYKIIKGMKPTCSLYAEKLIHLGLITPDDEKHMAEHYRALLEKGDPVVDQTESERSKQHELNWSAFLHTRWDEPTTTGVSLSTIKALSEKMQVLPEGFTLQPQVKKMMDARKQMAEGNLPMNWGFAETMAYATLLSEGYPIRLCGQDVCRGTFAHRHAVLHDQNSDTIYIPLSHLGEEQAQINLVDSFLSEEAVLAFEYGYSASDPNYLTIWEAQFGDFANGAQVVIDQFISSGEQKWNRLCGLVMFLPHGYEGIGPEHSSARLERYLQLCAQDNMQVVVPSTPSQIFHVLRRQMLRRYRKPLIVITPKSLLRHPLAVSPLSELEKGSFQCILGDEAHQKDVKRLVLCSGKIYYELLEKREQLKLHHIALVRIEQLYPVAQNELADLFNKTYQQAEEVVWCQEEPKNQGAWSMISPYLLSHLHRKQTLTYAGRPLAASPAAGYHAVHEKEQKKLISEALNLK